MGNVQRECSAACVRSGVSALVAVIFGMSILSLQNRIDVANSFGEYVTRRLNLISAVEQLEADPCWQVLKNDESLTPKPAELPLEKLKTYGCMIQPSNVKLTALDKDGKPTPNQPTNLRMEVAFITGINLHEAFKKTLDSRLMADAMRVSARFNFSIQRWQLRVIQQSVKRSPNTVIAENVDEAGMKKQWDALMDQLTTWDILEVARFEPPTMDDFEIVANDFRQLKIPPLNNGIDVFMAAWLVVALITLCLFWFWLNLREALMAGEEPEPATLFAMVRRSTTSATVFKLLTGVTAIVAALVAFRAFRNEPLLIAPAVACIVLGHQIVSLMGRFKSAGLPEAH